MKRFISFFILLISTQSIAQQVSGFIVDEEKSPIPFVSIHIQNSSNGTIANSKGYFSIEAQNSNDTLVFSCIGYELAKLNIEEFSYQKVIILKRGIQLDEVVIKSDNNFAKTIIKNIQRNRKKNDLQQLNFTTKLYVKSSLEKSAGLNNEHKSTLNFLEKYSEVQHYNSTWKEKKIGINDLVKRKPISSLFNNPWNQREKKIKKDLKTNPNLFYYDISDGNFNFYKSLIYIPKLGQNPFISPIGTIAFTTYNYEYKGSFYENDEIIHIVSVQPKRLYGAVFIGTLYIQESNWALKSLKLTLNKFSLHKYDKFSITQTYNQVDSTMTLSKQEFFYYYKSGIFNFHGSVYSLYNDYEFNPEKKLIKPNLIQVIADSSKYKDSTFWNPIRPINLTKEEFKFKTSADSITRLQQSNKYLEAQDSVKNQTSLDNILFTGIDHYNSIKETKWVIDPLIKQSKIFGIGGYRHALGGKYIKRFKNNKEISINSTTNYGFRNNDLIGDGGVSFLYAPLHFGSISLNTGSKYQMLTFMQNFATIFSRSNYIKNDFIELSMFREIINGLFIDVKSKYAQRKSIDNLELAPWSDDFFGAENTPQNFNDYNELNLKLSISFTPFQKYKLEENKKTILGSKWPNFNFEWEQGIPNVLQTKIKFQLLKLGLYQSFNIGTVGTSKYNAWFGKYLDASELEIPNFTFFRGTDNYLFSHPLYTFQLLGETHKSIGEFIQLNFIHHFHGALVKKIPFLKKRKIESVFGGGLLYINDNSFAHSETFVGLEVPFKIGDTKFKLGSYYTVAYSNYSTLSNMFKFGINVFNPFSNSWAF